MMWPVLGVLSVVAVYLLYLRYNQAGRLMAKVPGCGRTLPVIGDFFSFVTSSENVFKMFREVSRENRWRNITRLHVLDINYVVIYNPADIETVLSSSRFNHKREPYTFLKSWLGEGLLINSGDKWQQRRKLLTRAFHFNMIKHFNHSFAEHTETFLQRVHAETARPRTDLMPFVAQTTLAIMCETSMGIKMSESIKCSINEYFKALLVIGHCVMYRLVRVWTYFDWVYKLLPVSKQEIKACDVAHKFTNNIINERRIYREKAVGDGKIDVEHFDDDSYGKTKLAMLDLLLENEKEGKIDASGIREEVDTFLFEGHDTTAVALCFAIMSLANEPEIQERVYREMQQIFGDSERRPSMEDLGEMRYLERCIKETLRLYPSVPSIARTLVEDATIAGYKIPRGTNCAIHLFDVHRDERFFPEPDKFDPDRFLPEACASRHRYAYIPFSAGPRNCIGQKFAMAELKTVLSGLIRNYRMEAITRPQDVVFLHDLVLRTKEPVYARFIKRQPSPTI